MTDNPPDNATPTAPTNPPASGTIDITNLVETMRQVFVTLGVNFVFAAAIATPGLQWMNLPVISSIIKSLLKWVLNTVSKSTEMSAFFMTTAVRKASQAQDFIDAVNYKNNLPGSASDDEYEKAEQAQLDAFRNFVMFTN